MKQYLSRQTVAEKYDIKEIAYGLRELYTSLKGQVGIKWEVRALKRALVLFNHEFPRLPKKGCCPNCGFPVDNFFCPECGQRIYYNYNRRPIDELRRSTEFNHNDAEYLWEKQRRELDEYVRIMGIEWVLSKLYEAERSADPIDKNGIRDFALESVEKTGFRMTQGGRRKKEEGENESDIH